MRLILAAPCIALGFLASGCISKPAQELSLEQVCLQHFENDPVERDRCRLEAENRTGSVPDLQPQQLPVRTKGPGDL
jgi:hypothetical protein